MVRRLRIAVIVGGTVLAMAGLVGAWGKVSPEQRLQQALDATHTLTARFKEKVTGQTAGAAKSSHGTLAIAKPGRFRWTYTKPYREIIVATGKKIYVYDPDLQQVTVRNEAHALAAGPAALLSGKGRIADSFSVTSSREAGGMLWITLSPKKSDSNFTRIKVGLDSRNRIKTMVLTGHLKQVTHLQFSRIRRNVRLKDSLFQFEVPKGTDVINHTHAPGEATR